MALVGLACSSSQSAETTTVVQTIAPLMSSSEFAASIRGVAEQEMLAYGMAQFIDVADQYAADQNCFSLTKEYQMLWDRQQLYPATNFLMYVYTIGQTFGCDVRPS